LRGLTRNLNSETSKQLQSRGVELLQGNLQDRSFVDNAMRDCYGVFLCLNPWDLGGVREETKIGQMVIDLAVKHKIDHFVYSSVASANKASTVPHFQSKWEVEQYLGKSGLRFSILRPVWFMENFFLFKDKILKDGYLPMYIREDTKLQLIAIDDIGFFGALMFEHCDTWAGKTLEIAGDELTPTQITKELNCRLECFPPEQCGSEDWTKMYKWLNDKRYEADIPLCMKWNPNLKTFRTWLKEDGRLLLQGTPSQKLTGKQEELKSFTEFTGKTTDVSDRDKGKV